MEKLVRAQDTSNIDDTDMSPNELKERDKKRRRIKAKKRIDPIYTSTSSDEDVAVSEEKENSLMLPPFPKIDQFVNNQEMGKQSLINKHTNNSKNILTEKTLVNTTNSNSEQYHYKS